MKKHLTIIAEIKSDVNSPTKETLNIEYEAININFSEQLGILESLRFHILNKQRETLKTK